MATITSDRFLDSGVAVAAGEAWTLNGGVLTVRTDSRWHADAPAGMTGALGTTTISATLGGGVLFDARAVRWMPYTGGGGTVPAIGTTITQGGVTGYLLGAWASTLSAPSAVGAAMPATGFLKFREVTGGSFAAGALTGITATAASPDVAGWIEVVQETLRANTVPRRGYFRTRGDWFYLGDTTGIAGQVLQVPTNGGGADTHVPAVWIETAPGSDVYEAFPALLGTWFLAENLSTDGRSQFVQTLGNGQVRVGFDGAANAGFLPPAGCRVRVPNVLGRQCLSTSRSVNEVPNASLSTRPDFTTTTAGEIDFEFFMNDWYHGFTSPYKVRIVNCASFDIHTTSNEASPTELTNYVLGAYNGTSATLTAINNSNGGVITDCQFFRAVGLGSPISLSNCADYTFNGVNKVGTIAYAQRSGSATIAQSRNINQNGVFKSYCTTLAFITSLDCTFDYFSYIDRLVGISNTTLPKYGIICNSSSDNILINNFDFGGYADVVPYNGILNTSFASNITVHNGGTFENPIGGTLFPITYLFRDSGGCSNITMRRIYLAATASGLYTSQNTTSKYIFENISGTNGVISTAGVNAVIRGVRMSGGNSISAQSAVYGTHWQDVFTSDTEGRVWLAFNEPTAFTADQFEIVSLGVDGGFTSAGEIAMPSLGSSVIFTMPDFILGHTALANAAPTVQAINEGNFDIEYDIDTGAGFSGVWQTLSGPNLSAETFGAGGFKLKFKVIVSTAATTNAMRYIRVDTVSTAAAQRDGLYPLALGNSVTFTGLPIGCDIVVLAAGTNTILAQKDQQPTSSYSFTYSGPQTVDVGFIKPGFKPQYLRGLPLLAADSSIPVSLEFDRTYA